MEWRSIDVEGVTIRWRETGEGTPVVLIHGIPTGPGLWRHVAPRIKGARVCAWEMVGFGSSIPAADDHRDISVAGQASYLLAWMDAVGIERAVLGGHDLGGGVAQIAAVRSPERCAGLFLANAIGYDSWPIPRVKAMRAAGGLVERLPNAVFRPIFASFIRQGHDDPARAEESLAEHWPHYEKHGGAAAMVRQIRALDVRDTLSVADRLTGLAKPARIVWGAADAFQKLPYGERFARDLKGGLRVIPEGRHFTPEDHPEIVADEITGLVAETGPSAGDAS